MPPYIATFYGSICYMFHGCVDTVGGLMNGQIDDIDKSCDYGKLANSYILYINLSKCIHSRQMKNHKQVS